MRDRFVYAVEHHASPRWRELFPFFLAATVATVTACAGSPGGERYRTGQHHLGRAAQPSGGLAGLEEPVPVSAFPGGMLEPELLVRVVLARNTSLEAARQAWAAALASYPQVTSLDDPALSLALAPGSVSGDAPRTGLQLQLSQRLPWPGRLGTRGEQVLAGAEAGEAELRALQHRLAYSALVLFYDFYSVERSLEINQRHQNLLADIRESATAAYAVGRASPQDPLEAELEIARLRRQQVSLEGRREIVRARLNDLIQQDAGATLPPPPLSLPTPQSLPMDAAGARQAAVQTRPELIAARKRVEGNEAGVRLARLLYYPDFGLMAGYNAMMALPSYRTVVGVSIQIPIRLDRRRAAVEQAEAGLVQNVARLQRLQSQVGSEAEQAWQRAEEARRTVALYQDALLPAARDRLEAARSGFTTGQNDFTPLIQAERNVATLELEFELSLAAFHQALAELAWATGSIPGLPEEDENR